jgi:hypothetical protein
MKRNLTKFSLLLTALVFATVSLTGCGGSSSSDPVVTPPVDLGDYIFATSATETIDIVPDTDVTIEEWGSGSTITTDYSGDATYSPAIEVQHGGGWGDVQVLAVRGFTAGELDANYTSINFKIKGASTFIVKLPHSSDPGEADEEITFTIGSSEFITDDDADGAGGWYDVSLPTSVFSSLNTDLSANTEFGIIVWGAGAFYATDIYLGTDASNSTLAGDDDGDGAMRIFNSESALEVDLDWANDYAGYDAWGTSAWQNTVTDQPGYVGKNVIEVTGDGGGAWAAALGFNALETGFADYYTNLNFKLKGVAQITVNFTDGVAYPDATELNVVQSPASGPDADGWYTYQVSLSDYSALPLSITTGFGLIEPGFTTFYVTDIYFD